MVKLKLSQRDEKVLDQLDKIVPYLDNKADKVSGPKRTELATVFGITALTSGYLASLNGSTALGTGILISGAASTAILADFSYAKESKVYQVASEKASQMSHEIRMGIIKSPNIMPQAKDFVTAANNEVKFDQVFDRQISRRTLFYGFAAAVGIIVTNEVNKQMQAPDENYTENSTKAGAPAP